VLSPENALAARKKIQQKWAAVVPCFNRDPARLQAFLKAHAPAPDDPVWPLLFEAALSVPGAPAMKSLMAARGVLADWAAHKEGIHLLHEAIASQNKEWVCVLLDAGVPPHELDRFRCTPRVPT